MAAEDMDPAETQEWLDAIDDVVREVGRERAWELLASVGARARQLRVPLPTVINTPYVNTIPVDEQPEMDGDPELEQRIGNWLRWNAVAMVLQANADGGELGGHIASYASSATLYEVGYNHFWKAPTDESRGDLVYTQGHSAPGIYARAFLEGRLEEQQLKHFRREAGGGGLSSYPHPWLMPDFWQFPTVSMGLGPIMAINQAHFMRYLTQRGITDCSGRKVWAFMGDGEMDEPESLGSISLAGRDGLDNLVFVVNCNLQRLDGPVRGNGKIIQELETVFSGAGWNVIKVIWGSRWDQLLADDHDGLLRRRMMEAVDGEYQVFKARDGAFVREKFFGKYPELLERVSHMSDEEIWALNRGGHDPVKVHAAFKAAQDASGKPTVILAKTIKGYGMGAAGEGQNITHQAKKMDASARRAFRDRFSLELTDEEVDDASFKCPPSDSPELAYLKERREALGGGLPQRRTDVEVLPVPPLEAFKAQLEGSGEREISTTMAFVRVLSTILRDKKIAERVVPIVADESRTFGMEGMFRQLGIFSERGQLYEPEDREQLMFYREDVKGQILQEGINEAGAFSSWLAAATAYANHGVQMVPFYVFYSMFGFQRIGDLAWAAGDSRARGFLIGGTAGRTTLNGEGLQHEDGHSHLLSSTIPNCISYDPAYGYELAVIVQDGLRRMVAEQEDVYYYLTVMNENYVQPPMPSGAEEGILRGMHQIVSSADEAGGGSDAAVRLLGSGTILREVLAGAEMLREDFGVASDVFSVTSFSELRREAMEVERWNRLHPEDEPRSAFVSDALGGSDVPVVASTDYMRIVPDQIRPWVDASYLVLGTDGYGRSDFRKDLRSFFEVDRRHVVVAALSSLAASDAVPASKVSEAIAKYEIDTEVEAPWRR